MLIVVLFFIIEVVVVDKFEKSVVLVGDFLGGMDF